LTREPGDLPVTETATALGWRAHGENMSSLVQSASRVSGHLEAMRYGIAAILLGIVFIGVAGFAPLQSIHDAAHNTRHAVGFPCH
jgi:cobalt transporter subunit CbtB